MILVDIVKGYIEINIIGLFKKKQFVCPRCEVVRDFKYNGKQIIPKAVHEPKVERMVYEIYTCQECGLTFPLNILEKYQELRENVR